MADTAQPTNWGRWGETDERGTANYVTPKLLTAAAGLVRRGKVYSLSLPIQSQAVPVAPRRGPPQHFMILDGGDYAAGLTRKSGFQASDDYLALYTHGSTHIDALAHVWYDGTLYNGFSANTLRSTGAGKCGIDKLGHLVGRGVLLDFCRHRGETPLAGGTVLGPEDFAACAKAQGVELRQGDIVLMRTGWLASFDERDPAIFFRSEPGIGLAAGEWIGKQGFAAIGADNYAVEAIPTENGISAPVHRRLLRDYGCSLMELMVLDRLAAEEVWEFMFVAAPLMITGGVGSPINPLAIC